MQPVSIIEMIKTIFSKKMLITLIMGFAAGLPLALLYELWKRWLADEKVSLAIIGLTGLATLPYALKFLWAPFLDRYVPPFLGRRRGWLLLSQIGLIISIIFMATSHPVPPEDLHVITFNFPPIDLNFYFFSLTATEYQFPTNWAMFTFAFVVAFMSATQDIIIDAYRREHLNTNELGLGSSVYVYGYRIAMLLSGGGGLILADIFSFQTVYIILAACMIIPIIATLLSPEPTAHSPPKTITKAVIEPFIDFFKRDTAILILIFILLYKLGDTLAGAMTQPFYAELGFSKSEVGYITKLFGFIATMLGLFLGGITILKAGIYRSLWYFGFLQMASTAGFALLYTIGYNIPALTVVIGFENLSAGMGTAAFVAFMASLTNKKFTATQYALLTSLMGIPRVIFSSFTGILAEQMGWYYFFISCTLIAIPGMLLLYTFRQWDLKKKNSLDKDYDADFSLD